MRCFSSIILLSLLTPRPARAAEGWSGTTDTQQATNEATAARAPAAPTTADRNQLSPNQLSDSLEVPQLTKAQHSWLQPARRRLPSNDRAQTDFTAYTLEWGETKLGLASITVGALPRTQIGTVPVLDALQVPNAHIKVNAVRVGPWDMAVGANHYRLTAGDFLGFHSGVSAVQSVRIVKPWSVHLGTHYAVLGSDGVPTPSKLPAPLRGADGDDSKFREAQSGLEDTWHFRSRTFSMHLASDIRFNRRDSLILQARAMLWADVEKAFEAPPVLGLDEALSVAENGASPVSETYVASAAWQFSWKKVDLRMGLGISNVPGAWLLQSTDLSYRFGGSTRKGESRMRRTWKRNRADTLR